MSTKHTPGPWVYESRNGKHPQSNNGWGTEGLWGPNGERIINSGTGWEPEYEAPTEADARLIAAAPDLLAAAKAALADRFGGDDPVVDLDPINNQIRAAIAKAEGGAA